MSSAFILQLPVDRASLSLSLILMILGSAVATSVFSACVSGLPAA